MAESKSLWSVGEVAAYLRVPVATVYAWRARREGPVAIRVGRHLRFRPESVEEFLEARTDTAALPERSYE